MTARFGLDATEQALRARAEAIASTVERQGDRPLSREQLLDLFAALAPTGYLASTLPDAPAGKLGFAALVEGLSPHLPLLGNHSVQRYLATFGTPAQRAALLPDLLAGRSIASIAITEPEAGGDLTRIATSATREGSVYRISGRKTWVTHGCVADVFVVLAATEAGPTRFLVPASSPGLRRRALTSTGLRHLTFAELHFDHCEVGADAILGEPGQGNAGAKSAFPIARALAALQTIRIGEAALDLAAGFARNRMIFKQLLADSALVRDRIAAHAATLAAARLLAYRCMLELHDPATVAAASSVKALACQAALDACEWTLDLLGASALREDHASQRLARNARMMAVVDGTVVLNRFVAARRVLAAERPGDRGP